MRNSLAKCNISIFFIQIVSSLGFSVLYSTLILYLKDQLALSTSLANSIVGVFLAFNYLLHILGGLWGGKLFSNRVLFCLGMLAQFIGGVLISVPSLDFLYYGLAVFLTGSGLNVTCLNCILIQYYAPEDKRREASFLWNYSGMSLGFFIGYTLSGYFQLSRNYHKLFLISSLGNIAAILICFAGWKYLADISTSYSQLSLKKRIRASSYGAMGIVALPFVLYQTFRFADWSNLMILIIGLLMFAYLFVLAKNDNRLKACVILIVVTTFFWTLYQIGPMGLTLFTKYNVNRQLGEWMIPPQWYPNTNTFCIIVAGPVFALLLQKLRVRGLEISLAAQFATAVLLIGIAFLLLPVGIAFANNDGLINPIWVVGYYVFQSLGEILISPLGYAMIGVLVPNRLQGLMMGVLMMYCGVGASLASYTSNFIIKDADSTAAMVTNASYSQVFLGLGIAAIFVSVLVMMFSSKIRILCEGKSGVVEMSGQGPIYSNYT